MPTSGKAAASTALPQPPGTSQNVPMTSAESFASVAHLCLVFLAALIYSRVLTLSNLRPLDPSPRPTVLRNAIQAQVEPSIQRASW